MLLSLLLSCATGTSPVVHPRLESGLSLQRGIQGGEAHVYPVELQAGQFLRVTIREEGIDLIAQLTGPADKVAVGADGLPSGSAYEDLAYIAAADGGYQLRLSAPEGQDSGRYLLRVDALGKPRDRDRLRSEAVRLTWTGFHGSDKPIEERLRSLEKALALWQEIEDPGKPAEVLYVLGSRQYKLETYDVAAGNLLQAASLWGRRPDSAAKVIQLHSLTVAGYCLGKSDRHEEAREAHRQALSLARDVEDSDLQAANLDALAQLAVDAGESLRGIDLHRQALELARQAKNREREGVILNNLAYAYEQTGEMQKAIEFYQQALDLARTDSDREAEMKYLNNLGETYLSLGDRDKAFDFFQLAAGVNDLENRALEAKGKVLINLARAYRHREQLDQARSTLDRALALGREIRSREVQVFALSHLAFLLLHQQRPAEAAGYAREAVGLGGSLEEEISSRYALGSALRDSGESASARAELAKALAQATRRGDRARQAEINLVLARMDREAGDPASTLQRVKSAIQLIESRRDRVVDLELKTSFLAAKHDYYELQVDTLMALHAQSPAGGFAADALQASEQARARGLLEILNEAGTDIRVGVDPALVDKERSIREEVNARDRQRRELLAAETPDREKLADAELKLEEALDRQQEVQVELRQGSPRYASLTQPQPLNLEEIQRQVLSGESLLLEYFLGSQQSYLWVVGPGSFASFELPGRERIEGVARRYYKALTTRNEPLPGESRPDFKKRVARADVEAEAASIELSELILQPAAKLLGDRTLLIVADGALQYIPFAALPIPGTEAPLVFQHEIVNLPSASVLAVMRRELQDRQPAPRTLAIFADPVFEEDDARLRPKSGTSSQVPLTETTPVHRGGMLDESREKDVESLNFRRLAFSRKEAETITSLVEPASDVFAAVGFDASTATVSACGLDRYRNVHFATHGFLDSQHPELSGLVLSRFNERGEDQEGFLRLNDIYNLRLNADLVVLSACRTALGKEIRGEGLVGLTRGFMYAGAARVLASLWSVEDRATAELMGSFYRGMLRGGLSPTAALRRAQLERRQEQKSPYFWAGFSLQGEWQ